MKDSSEQLADTDPASVDKPVISRPLMAALAAILAAPAAVPILVLVAPDVVPFVPPIEPVSTTMVVFLVATSAVILLANWGLLFMFARWLDTYAKQV